MGKSFNKIEYNNDFNRENYYRFSLTMRKDKRNILEKAAETAGMSKNAFILQAIEEKIERESKI